MFEECFNAQNTVFPPADLPTHLANTTLQPQMLGHQQRCRATTRLRGIPAFPACSCLVPTSAASHHEPKAQVRHAVMAAAGGAGHTHTLSSAVTRSYMQAWCSWVSAAFIVAWLPLPPWTMRYRDSAPVSHEPCMPCVCRACTACARQQCPADADDAHGASPDRSLTQTERRKEN